VQQSLFSYSSLPLRSESSHRQKVRSRHGCVQQNLVYKRGGEVADLQIKDLTLISLVFPLILGNYTFTCYFSVTSCSLQNFLSLYFPWNVKSIDQLFCQTSSNLHLIRLFHHYLCESHKDIAEIMQCLSQRILSHGSRCQCVLPQMMLIFVFGKRANTTVLL
jgi:hypothetical protein